MGNLTRQVAELPTAQIPIHIHTPPDVMEPLHNGPDREVDYPTVTLQAILDAHIGEWQVMRCTRKSLFLFQYGAQCEVEMEEGDERPSIYGSSISWYARSRSLGSNLL